MLSVLVTGGCGFIGSNFIRYLLTAEPEVTVVNLDALTYAGSPANLADLEDDPRYRFVRGSITDPDEEAVITLSTPSGSPASWRIRASCSIDSGVCWAGFITIVQPAATAGPILRVPIAIGKFQGVMRMLGPTGCLSTRVRPWPATFTV